MKGHKSPGAAWWSISLSLFFHGCFVIALIVIPKKNNVDTRRENILVASILLKPSTILPHLDENKPFSSKRVSSVQPRDRASLNFPAPVTTSISSLQNDTSPGRPHRVSLGATEGSLRAVEEHEKMSTTNDPAIVIRLVPELKHDRDIAVPYPARAKAMLVQGVVRLRLTVSALGRVVDAQVLSGPHYGLREAAVRLASMLDFWPATDEHGRALSVDIEHEIVFKLTPSS